MRVPLRTTWSELGALTSASAAAAMIVCCLPFATGLIGAGVAAAGAQFAPVQPYLTVTSLAFLAFAFYQAYRPQPSCANDACASSAVGRRRLVVWFVAVVVALLLTVERWANWVIYWTL